MYVYIYIACYLSLYTYIYIYYTYVWRQPGGGELSNASKQQFATWFSRALAHMEKHTLICYVWYIYILYYIYIYIYTYIHTYIHTCMHTYIHTYIHIMYNIITPWCCERHSSASTNPSRAAVHEESFFLLHAVEVPPFAVRTCCKTSFPTKILHVCLPSLWSTHLSIRLTQTRGFSRKQRPWKTLARRHLAKKLTACNRACALPSPSRRRSRVARPSRSWRPANSSGTWRNSAWMIPTLVSKMLYSIL